MIFVYFLRTNYTCCTPYYHDHIDTIFNDFKNVYPSCKTFDTDIYFPEIRKIFKHAIVRNEFREIILNIFYVFEAIIHTVY